MTVRRKGGTSEQRRAALRDLEESVRLEFPGSPVLARDHTNRGRLLYRDGRVKESLAACDAALAVVPDYLDAHLLRIGALLDLRRYDEVIRSCDAVLAKGKPSADLYELRGLARIGRRDFAGAIEDDTLALALRPGSIPLLTRRGWSYLVSNAHELALRDFEERSGSTPRTPTPTTAVGPHGSGSAATARRWPTRRRRSGTPGRRRGPSITPPGCTPRPRRFRRRRPGARAATPFWPWSGTKTAPSPWCMRPSSGYPPSAARCSGVIRFWPTRPSGQSAIASGRSSRPPPSPPGRHRGTEPRSSTMNSERLDHFPRTRRRRRLRRRTRRAGRGLVYWSVGLEDRTLLSAVSALALPAEIASAVPLALASDGSAVQAGTLADASQVDVYRYVAPVSGRVAFYVDTNVGFLTEYLSALDARGNELLNHNQGLPDQYPDFDVVDVAKGETYYLVVRGDKYAFTGDYLFGVTGSLSASDRLFPTPGGVATTSGTIETPGQINAYEFIAPTSGRLTFREGALQGTSFASNLILLDDTGNELVAGSTVGDGVDEMARLDVTAGRTYLILAGEANDGTGTYTLGVSPDDFGDTPDTSYALPLRGDVVTTQSGAIEVAGDRDMFRFVAPATGPMTVGLEVPAADGLNGSLSVLDNNGSVIGTDQAGGGPGLSVQFQAVRGQPYFAEVAGSGTSTGHYSLTVTPVQFGGDFGSAYDMTPDATSSPLEGMIGSAGQVEYFRFVAPATGVLSARGTESREYPHTGDHRVRRQPEPHRLAWRRSGEPPGRGRVDLFPRRRRRQQGDARDNDRDLYTQPQPGGAVVGGRTPGLGDTGRAGP